MRVILGVTGCAALYSSLWSLYQLPGNTALSMVVVSLVHVSQSSPAAITKSLETETRLGKS